MEDEGNGKTWFVSDGNGNTVGPVGFDELRRLVHTGEFTPDSLVRGSLAEEWKPAGEVFEFGNLEKYQPARAPGRKRAVLRGFLRVLSYFWIVPRFLVVSVFVPFVCFLSKGLWFLLRNICVGAALALTFTWRRGIVPAAAWLHHRLNRWFLEPGGKIEKTVGFVWKCLTGILYYVLFVPLRALFRVTAVPINRYWNKCEARRIANGAEVESPAPPPRLSWRRRIAYSSAGIVAVWVIVFAIAAAVEPPFKSHTYGGGSYQYASNPYQYAEPQSQYSGATYQYQQPAPSYSPQAQYYLNQYQSRYQPEEKGFFAKAGDWISDHGTELVVGAIAIAAGAAAYHYANSDSSSSSSPGYTYQSSHATEGPYRPFTQSQKADILRQNMERNGGILRSDYSGQPLVMPQRYTSGYTPSPYEAQIDHIQPRSGGGWNSAGNAQVLSREENLLKSDSTSWGK